MQIVQLFIVINVSREEALSRERERGRGWGQSQSPNCSASASGVVTGSLQAYRSHT